MDDAQYCPVCFSALEPSDIEEGACPICGADLSEPDTAEASGDNSDATEGEDYWEDVEKAIIATLFFLDE